MILEIISRSSKSALNINWLEVNTQQGNFVIQTGHSPTIFALQPESEIIFEHSDGEQERMRVADGIVHITRNAAKLIINT